LCDDMVVWGSAVCVMIWLCGAVQFRTSHYSNDTAVYCMTGVSLRTLYNAPRESEERWVFTGVSQVLQLFSQSCKSCHMPQLAVNNYSLVSLV